MDTAVEIPAKPAVDVKYQVGSLENIRAGWFGYRPRPDFHEKDFYYDGLRYCRWEHCRDRVQIILKDHIAKNGLWFSHRKNTGANIRFFFKKLEKQLKVKPRSTFQNTEHPEYCIWMDVSPWWLESLVRRSFLTIALRSAQGYKLKKDNFIECFQQNKYGKESMTAINLFLQGYTNYRGKHLHMFEGWSRLFRSKSEDAVKEVLFKRRSKNNVNQAKANW
jgi:hypothetical protein